MAASSVRWSLAAAALFVLLVAPQSGRTQDRAVVLTYLGNMGVHLERGGQRVVIARLAVEAATTRASAPATRRYLSGCPDSSHGA